MGVDILLRVPLAHAVTSSLPVVYVLGFRVLQEGFLKVRALQRE